MDGMMDIRAHYGSEQPVAPVSNHSLSHELGSKQMSEQGSKQMSTAERESKASSAEQAKE